MCSNFFVIALSVGEKIISLFIDGDSIFLDVHFFEIDVVSYIFIADGVESFLVCGIVDYYSE